MSSTVNADPAELEKFSALASHWWDPTSEFAPLHHLNPLRLGWIDALGQLSGKRVLDVGCGGGILSESMARMAAEVKGIDLAHASLEVARLHGLESGVKVDYEKIPVEVLAQREPKAWDIVTCMEMLEHVPDPEATVAACSQLLREDGMVFFSTIHRNPKAFLLAIVGAEYLARLLPRGTHSYRRFIRPSELARWARSAGLVVEELVGITYNPVSRIYRLSADTDVNYMMACRKA